MMMMMMMMMMMTMKLMMMMMMMTMMIILFKNWIFQRIQTFDTLKLFAIPYSSPFTLYCYLSLSLYSDAQEKMTELRIERDTQTQTVRQQLHDLQGAAQRDATTRTELVVSRKLFGYRIGYLCLRFWNKILDLAHAAMMIINL